MTSRSPSSVNASYHPGGYGTSPSLQRARKPYILKNALTGGLIFTFAMGVYVYSISAVKQDDFADVADLLPPLEERSKIRTIEDEARDSKSSALQSIASALPKSSKSQSTPLPNSTSSASSISKELPTSSSTSISTGVVFEAADAVRSEYAGIARWVPKRLSEMGWVKRSGLVEEGKGNLLVWGAPDVERVGRVQDAVVGGSGRLV